MSEDLTPAPLNPYDEDSIALGHTIDEVTAWIDHRGSTCVPDRINMPKLHTWVFNKPQRLLSNNLTTINLTRMECAVLDLLTSSEERVISNEDILMKLNKDPYNYKGLPMCLSRLQAKFKKFTKGDNLLRSVRSRGYCLIQTINPE
ncbi:transcriptional regulator [Pseudomonas sp. A-R-26]|jgi:DNA-binding winged helix-turn-helix (wHTH) protein|uniref:winged helix-turn-helix domain-containing protein n=1 Tax=Pseudomonas sp. A-R-26 TaxID=2832404 RepID=UPI001CBB50C5|nr:helix-turn-helix domain-containing protein [Pseudomonas sp. A-R-26]